MSPTVTRLGHGPALFKTSRRRDANAGGRSAHKWIWAILAIALALLIAVPAFAQAAPAAPAAAPAPGVGDAVDRALGQLSSGAASGGTQSAPLSLSLQVLIIMAC